MKGFMPVLFVQNEVTTYVMNNILEQKSSMETTIILNEKESE